MKTEAESPFFIVYRIPYSDCTVGNHVYYSRLIEWLERARTEFFRHREIPFQSLVDQGILLPVITCHVDYKAAARYDDEVKIEVKVEEIGRLKLAFGYQITRVTDGKLIATARTIHVCTSLQEKPQRLPEMLRRAMGFESERV